MLALCMCLHISYQIEFSSFSQGALLYSGKLSREKSFANFTVLWLYVKAFSAKSGGIASFGMVKESVKVFSVKIVFFTSSQKFSPSKVSRYTVLGLY